MKYALAFAASEFVNFRQVEFISLCKLFGIDTKKCVTSWEQTDWVQPFVEVELESDTIVQRLIERSVLIKSVYHIWCKAASIADVKSQNQINLLLDYEPRNLGRKSSTAETPLRRVYYGRLVGSSQRRRLINAYRLADRAYLGNTSMDVRLAGIMANIGQCAPGSLVWDPFIGTGSIVLAASVWGAMGAGSDIDYSLLHGIGMSPKAGQGKRMDGECLRSSYAQYGLESRYLDVIVADTATLHRLLRVPGVDELSGQSHAIKPNNESGLFDAILTDPPYGLRESSKRVASRVLERAPSLVTPERLSEITGMAMDSIVQGNGDGENLIEVPHDLPHFPHKEVYPLEESYNDLVNLSNRLLRPDGRLVVWLAMKRVDFSELSKSIHRHPRLRLLTICEQILNSRNSRYLITMQKLRENEPDEVGEITIDQFFAADPVLS